MAKFITAQEAAKLILQMCAKDADDVEAKMLYGLLLLLDGRYQETAYLYYR